MFEITTDALVIDKIESGEHDARVLLYSKDLGVVMARGTSMRKVTSKLSAHFDPLTFVSVRLIQKSDGGMFQIGDALLIDRCGYWRESPEALKEALKLISVFKETGFNGGADINLWNAVYHFFTRAPEAPFHRYSHKILECLGFSSQYAKCDKCAVKNPTQFLFRDLAFYCDTCVPQANTDNLRYYI